MYNISIFCEVLRLHKYTFRSQIISLSLSFQLWHEEKDVCVCGHPGPECKPVVSMEMREAGQIKNSKTKKKDGKAFKG